MTIKSVTWTTKKYVPIATGCCDSVVICLTEDCLDKTLDGLGIVEATIENAGRNLSPGSRATLFQNPRCDDLFQYSLKYDDAQMALDIGGLPYELTCDCISEVNPYYCSTVRIIERTISPTLSCLTAVDEFPEEYISAGCIVSLVDHASLPDGLYYYNGDAWVQLGAFAT